MALYLFGIGGSGARVLKSFVHLVASGIDLKNIRDNTIKLILIDTDNKSNDTDKLENIVNTYSEVRNSVLGDNINNENNKYFKHNISLNKFSFTSFNPDATFYEFLDGDSMNADYKLLMNALYDSSPQANSNTELNLKLSVGFKGNPNLGGTIFNMLDYENGFGALLNGIDEIDYTFFVSSIFGGNGSSGFPALLNLFKTHRNNQGVPGKKGALTVLPYFNVKTPQVGGAIDSKVFNSKTKAALSYYAEDNTINTLNAHYYIADNKRVVYPYSEGGERNESNNETGQINEANCIEFFGGLSIVDFCNKSDNELLRIGKYGFGLNMNNDGVGDEIIHIGHFKSINNYSAVLEPFTKFAYMVRYFDELSADKISDLPALQSNTNFFENNTDSYKNILNRYFAYWKVWLNELENNTDLDGAKNNKRVLKFFNMRCDNTFDNFIYNPLVATANRTVVEYNNASKINIKINSNRNNSYSKPYLFWLSLSQVADDVYQSYEASMPEIVNN